MVQVQRVSILLGIFMSTAAAQLFYQLQRAARVELSAALAPHLPRSSFPLTVSQCRPKPRTNRMEYSRVMRSVLASRPMNLEVRCPNITATNYNTHEMLNCLLRHLCCESSTAHSSHAPPRHHQTLISRRLGSACRSILSGAFLVL